MRIVSVINQKGGVGKTATSINLSAGLCMNGKKVLLIDLDPQASATLSLFKNYFEESIYNVFNRECDIDKTIKQYKENFYIVPSDIQLAGVEIRVDFDAYDILKNQLGELKGFDYIIIDNPPAINLFTINSLLASQKVIIPVKTDYLSLKGFDQLKQTIERVQKKNSDLSIQGVVFTQYDQRRNLDKDVIEGFDLKEKTRRFKTTIRTNVEIAEAPSRQQTIFEYAPKSNGADDYYNLTKEVLSDG